MTSSMSRVGIQELNQTLNNGIAFIACASFECRSMQIAQCVDADKVMCAFVFSTDETKVIQNRRHDLACLFQTTKEVIVKKNDPFSCQREAYKVFNEVIRLGIQEILIDVTTFTHEMLLIILGVLWKKKALFRKVMFVYVGAETYCPNEKEIWLSKGCREVRSILGFPGLLVPKKQLCLTILVGFEHERALGLIEKVDPDILYMGCGIVREEHVTSSYHLEPMATFNNLHRSLVASRPNVNTFEFSAKDIYNTMAAIQNVIKDSSNYNQIIVPMNTKMSTLAIGMIALENPQIQLCYAEPETYNYENYSSCGNSVMIYTWDDLSNSGE